MGIITFDFNLTTKNRKKNKKVIYRKSQCHNNKFSYLSRTIKTLCKILLIQLKAQLARMTHSLELSPKGIYKQNDENPKVIEF